MAKLTLAVFISDTREKLGFSQLGLAKRSNIPLDLIERLEAGMELFLATPVRQKLAKGLKVEPSKIKTYEKHDDDYDKNAEYIESIKERILTGELEGNKCPVCKSELVCRIAEMYDLEDRLVKHPKARCSKCPFLIK